MPESPKDVSADRILDAAIKRRAVRAEKGRYVVVEKKGPFSPMFCQIVALTFPHQSVLAGFLLVALLFPSFGDHESGSLMGRGEPQHISRRKRKTAADAGVPERNRQRK
jgi:hypothetical protein